MIDFYKGYILAYFKNNNCNYSFSAIAKKLGISILEVDEIISCLIEEGMLEYNENHMLSLTAQGRMKILNKPIDYYNFNKENKCYMRIIHPTAAIDQSAIYIPENFLSKL